MCVVGVIAVGVGRAGSGERAIADLVVAAAARRGTCICAWLLWLRPGWDGWEAGSERLQI